MAISKGATAPNFKLLDTNGELFELSSVKSTVVVYFYPKDFTPGCTKEACSFRDNFDFFNDLNIPIIGISKDSVKKHKDFKEKYKLPFTLLSDIDGKVSKQYDALIPVLGLPKRITYLINKEMKIEGVYDSLLGNESHISKMISLIKKG